MRQSSSQTSKADISKKQWLYREEVQAIRKAIRQSDSLHSLRDEILIFLSYQHGLRSVESANLTWDDIHIDGRQHNIVIRRAKHRGRELNSYVHGLVEEEVRMLKRLRGKYPNSPYVFASQKGTSLGTRAIRRIVKEAAKLAGLEDVHHHLLRHACGYQLINGGADVRLTAEFLGHKNMQSTMRYTKIAPNRLKELTRLL